MNIIEMWIIACLVLTLIILIIVVLVRRAMGRRFEREVDQTNPRMLFSQPHVAETVLRRRKRK